MPRSVARSLCDSWASCTWTYPAYRWAHSTDWVQILTHCVAARSFDWIRQSDWNWRPETSREARPGNLNRLLFIVYCTTT